jgi:hypothetical protein
VQDWRSGRAAIEETVRDTRRWIASVASLTPAPMGDLNTRLIGLEDCLRAHFEQGCHLYRSVSELLWCVEVDSALASAQADHDHLMGRLQLLALGLRQSASSPEAFQSYVEQLEWFFDDLDQHEEREADSLQWLLQSSCE